eukprot:m.10005 g.10005  ORF g.10005 m.10005 type:complete len:696 (+) comp4179_c0_seq1:2-2089(+)
MHPKPNTIMESLLWLLLFATATYAKSLCPIKFNAVDYIGENLLEFHVDNTKGDDVDNNGSMSQPFKTITACVAAMKHCTSNAKEVNVACTVHAGIYTETVKLYTGHEDNTGKRILRGVGNQTKMSGVDVLDTSAGWANNSCIYRTKIPSVYNGTQQLFYNQKMMVYARYPNVDIQQYPLIELDRSAWQQTNEGSVYGHIVDRGLANANFSWNGALATLNVAHQFFTWTRPVANHTVGSTSFDYQKNLPGLASYSNNPNASKWSQNQFFLSGKLEALDAPGEWFIDDASNMLYFRTPDCEAPANGSIAVKAREILIDSSNAVSVSISNMQLFGGALQMANCSACSISNVDLVYPTYNREIPEMEVPSHPSVSCQISGSHIAIEDVSLSYTNNQGLDINGFDINATNVLVQYTGWFGTLTYTPVKINGNHIRFTHGTVHHFGNAGVLSDIPNTTPQESNTTGPMPMQDRYLEVSYTHIHHSGLVGEDTAALYTGGWASAGQHWHHNWVHDASEKCIRGDDQSQNMTVHHNVVYNCGEPIVDPNSGTSGLGLIIKGDGHLIFANTIYMANYTEMCMPGCPEPYKPFRPQYPLLPHQNVRTQIFNSASKTIKGYPCSCHNKTFLNHSGGNQSAIYHGDDLQLTDPKNFDFRPSKGSPLVDAGVVFPPYTDGYHGSAPDIGAYEYGQPLWRAGCTGMEGC